MTLDEDVRLDLFLRANKLEFFVICYIRARELPPGLQGMAFADLDRRAEELQPDRDDIDRQARILRGMEYEQ